jgi:LPPG:FO 2-phospho-L-lactate transferase
MSASIGGPFSMKQPDDEDDRPVLALCGGVGGAKLAFGLSSVLPSRALAVVVNTGDDFTHMGLRICPDINTVVYTLAGLSDPVKGWGRRDETWNFMRALGHLQSEDTWFNLGDADLAMHIERTRRLARGESLSQVTDILRRSLGVGPAILPMSDEPVATRVHTQDGCLDFQDYFVRLQCRPEVDKVEYDGADRVVPLDAILKRLRDPRLRAVVICPSNPLLSIGPVLAIPHLRKALRDCPAPVIAISPIVAGSSVKGPTAKMMDEMGIAVTPASVAEMYRDVVDLLVVDSQDADVEMPDGVARIVAPIVMKTDSDKVDLARAVLAAVDAFTAQCNAVRRP